MKLNQRITQITVVPDGESLFHERGFTISIEDQAAGEYVCIRANDDDGNMMMIDPDEWPTLRDAINRMIRLCHPNTEPQTENCKDTP